MTRVATISEKLKQAFSPTHLEVIDDSADHLGHTGSSEGAGHYTVIISATDFAGKTPVKRHQMIYEVLGEMIGPEIHALRIQVL